MRPASLCSPPLRAPQCLSSLDLVAEGGVEAHGSDECCGGCDDVFFRRHAGIRGPAARALIRQTPVAALRRKESDEVVPVWWLSGHGGKQKVAQVQHDMDLLKQEKKELDDKKLVHDATVAMIREQANNASAAVSNATRLADERCAPLPSSPCMLGVAACASGFGLSISVVACQPFLALILYALSTSIVSASRRVGAGPPRCLDARVSYASSQARSARCAQASRSGRQETAYGGTWE